MGIDVGTTASVTLVVGVEDIATAMGSGDVEVLATPRLVALVEQAAVAALSGRLPTGSTSVGSRIDLRHLAPSHIGTEITASAEVTEIVGNKITYSVRAHAIDTVVATGTHWRVIVELKTFGD